MNNKTKLFFLIVFILSASFIYAQNKNENGRDPRLFFEDEYRQTWDSLAEYEQFAIACSSNIFERNNQFHLDFSNKVLRNKKSKEGIDVLNENWGINNSDDLMKAFNELTEGEQNAAYVKLKALLEKYPEATVIEIGEKEELTVTEVSRLYFVKEMQGLLGIHNIEAWIDARRISIIRWGIGAGYISLSQGTHLIKPIVREIKNNYSNYEDFFAHWMAGYCFNEVFSSTCPECTEKLIAANDAARAYIPFEELPFTGKNADKNHCMTINEGVYTPSEEAEKMIPVQKVFVKYWKEEPSETVLADFIKEEEIYPQISNIIMLPRFVLMQLYSTADKRIDYVESKKEYLASLPQTSQNFSYVMKVYLSDLNKIYRPQKVVDIYDSLNDSLKKNQEIYYQYGYSYYLLAGISQSIVERDFCVSRAVTVFNRLKNNGFSLDKKMNSWLNAVTR